MADSSRACSEDDRPTAVTRPESFILSPALLIRPLDPQAVFGNTHPLEVDVGCGKGRFLIARAGALPEVNFLGLDWRLKRVEKVDRKLRRAGLANVRLAPAEAAWLIAEWLPPTSVRACYIFFPDPWPKRRHRRRRLFDSAFPASLHRTLMADGCVHVATDHADYFERIRALLRADVRFTEVAPYRTTAEERTEFETTFLKLGTPVGRCSFRKAAPLQPIAAAPPPTP